MTVGLGCKRKPAAGFVSSDDAMACNALLMAYNNGDEEALACRIGRHASCRNLLAMVGRASCCYIYICLVRRSLISFPLGAENISFLVDTVHCHSYTAIRISL